MTISEHFNFPPAGIFHYENVTPSEQDNRRKARQHVKILSRFNHSQQLTANYALFSIPFAARNYFTLLHKRVLLKRVKIARLYKRNVSGRGTLLPGTELMPVSFNKRQQNEEAFFQKHSWCAHVAPMLKNWETLFPVSVFVSKKQIMLTLHGRELKRKCEHASGCKNFASTDLIFASNPSEGQILRALSNWMGPIDTPNHIKNTQGHG